MYNPATIRLATEINATHMGAELEPSHLFWQGIDPAAAIEALGDLVYNAAAKDTRINEAATVNGVLDDRFGRVSPDEPGAAGLGGRYTLSRWPENSSWDFVAVGRGHDVTFWRRFLAALEKVDPDMAVNIEHEDAELDQIEGPRFAAQTLREAAGRRKITVDLGCNAMNSEFNGPAGGGGQRGAVLALAGGAAPNLLTQLHLADTFDHTGSSGLRYIVKPPTARVHQHLGIGQGEVNCDELFATLAEINFDGIATVCVFAWEERARQSLVFNRETVGQYLAKDPVGHR